MRLKVRPNITIAKRQDQNPDWRQEVLPLGREALRGILTCTSPVLNVVELFAGAGGMGLGFLLARRGRKRYRLVFSAEVSPIYVETLRFNHNVFMKHQRSDRTIFVPKRVEPVDLRSSSSLEKVGASIRATGELHVLIGGPPCQGFSSANRNSWNSSNPHNHLVEVFKRYVVRLQPLVFLMENVQGILWTPKKGKTQLQPPVLEDFTRRMAAAGYLVFPKLLDAVWYGVPQYRSRFFILGIRRDLGYRLSDFGTWGPFPTPTHGPGANQQFVTVKDAIGDLPAIGNGNSEEEIPYIQPSKEALRLNPFLRQMRINAPRDVILDHITSKHTKYVINRYQRIPPGGNWQNIAHTLTNYADVQRTHSNIYRRLTWDDPSITIGHYRKSMIVHPQQQRGLSLREAGRLQSLPDWFRFVGTTSGSRGGLMHKQQQLANAVCPLVTKALAEFILGL